MADKPISFPQSISVNDLSIILTNGQSVNIRRLLVDLSYFEDLYSFAVSGYMHLRDGLGIIEKLNLSGVETIRIQFDFTETQKRKTQYFRLYTIPSRDPIGPMNSEFIKLYFCSEELFLSEQTKVTKSYNTEISTIINTILNENLKVDKNKKSINVDSTYGTYNFNIPTLKPFETISWLSIYALPKESAYTNPGADMLFFENVDGFYFKSLRNLYKQPIFQIYTYQQQNIAGQNLGALETNALDLEFIKAFNSLEDIESGTFANRLITLDPITRKVKTTDFNYNNYKEQKLNPGSVLDETQNKLGKTQTQEPIGKLKLAISNSGQKNQPWSRLVNGYGVAHDIQIEEFVPKRTAQIALANYTLVKLKVPCNPYLKVGQVINFKLPSILTRELDSNYSGNYLITAVRHIIRPEGGSESIIEIAKDSEVATTNVVNNSLG